MHGCLIALIVAACLMIPVVGILAAIAIPAYNDYLARSTVTQAYYETYPLQVETEDFRLREQRCPQADDIDFDGITSIPGTSLASGSVVDTGSDDTCALEFTLGDTQKIVAGKRLRLEYDVGSGEWSCSGDLKDLYLPTACRR